jgi:hypothetical protein
MEFGLKDLGDLTKVEAFNRFPVSRPIPIQDAPASISPSIGLRNESITRACGFPTKCVTFPPTKSLL